LNTVEAERQYGGGERYDVRRVADAGEPTAVEGVAEDLCEVGEGVELKIARREIPPIVPVGQPSVSGR